MADLTPFDPEKHTPKDVGLGGDSTEYLITTETPDGEVIVLPSIWWGEDGEPVFLGDPETGEVFTDAVQQMAKRYEESTGQLFPRFGAAEKENYEKADTWAQERSASGGATNEPLTLMPENLDETGFESSVE